MKSIFYIFTSILILIAGIAQAQTPTQKLGKPKEMESGAVKTDTATSRTVVGSSPGKSDSTNIPVDSIQTLIPSDTAVMDKPIEKGK